MEKIELLEKNKNKVLNIAIILFALLIVFNIYKSSDEQLNLLTAKKKDELKKNRVMEEIAVLEKKIEGYKKVFAEKDMGSIFDAISSIAKNNSVKIISIKPVGKETGADYSETSLLITISSPNYHSLGNFISQIEANKDIYSVSEVSIDSADSKSLTEGESTDLNVILKINTISY